MNSTLYLYATELDKDRRMIVDDISYYLSTCDKISYNEYQFIKHDKDIRIKVKTDIDCPSFEKFYYNYVSIINNYSDANTEAFIHYYFINKINYIAPDTIELNLIFDDLNTFNKLNLLGFSDRTLVYREHKDRFKDTTPLVKIVDDVDEEINIQLFTNGSLNVIRRDDDSSYKWDMKWYILIQYNTDSKGFVSFIPEYDIGVPLYDPADQTIADYVVGGINRFNVTQSDTYKLFEVPYCPIDLEFDSYKYIQTNQQDFSGYYMYFKGVSTTYALGILYATQGTNTIFTTIGYMEDYYESHNPLNLLKDSVNLGNISLLTTQSRTGLTKTTLHNKDYEPKLLNSNFGYKKFIYDSYSFIPRLENNNYSGASNVNITYTPAPYDSVGLFTFDYTNVSSHKRIDDYNVMLYKRQNEVPLFNSSYLNYMRNGYNYDLKSRNLSLITGILGVGTSSASALGKGNFVGAGVGSATGVFNQALNFVKRDEQIMKTKQDALMQGISVSGSDDLVLFHHYTGIGSSLNQGRLCYLDYAPKEHELNNIYNIFRLTGYATNMFKVPNTDNRRCFNYVRCEAWFTYEYDARMINYINDIKDKFKQGVTYFHKISNDDRDYDFSQELENWETFIVAR